MKFFAHESRTLSFSLPFAPHVHTQTHTYTHTHRDRLSFMGKREKKRQRTKNKGKERRMAEKILLFFCLFVFCLHTYTHTFVTPPFFLCFFHIVFPSFSLRLHTHTHTHTHIPTHTQEKLSAASFLPALPAFTSSTTSVRAYTHTHAQGEWGV
eukprot:TRINITY_DN2521_c0_g3_i2.p2 TRINITY_DN2521_c0_g3~~TRINITY_DN2521_c0_g3_i2.p2  ORF type:complete len:153 (+),score=0.65 TRINITY_DN2521_c0_g3_i2:166-624(+)